MKMGFSKECFFCTGVEADESDEVEDGEVDENSVEMESMLEDPPISAGPKQLKTTGR